MAKYTLKFNHTLKDMVATEEGRDAKTQSKVYGANRYFFLAIAIYAMIALGRFMWAYPSFYEMLIKSGAYRWVCYGQAPTFEVKGMGAEITCNARNMAINAVLLTVSGSTYIGSIFAAASNVALGGKICSMMGAGSMLTGMLLMGFSSMRFRAYIPAAVMIGFGMDFIVFPSFNATLLFPNRKLLITSILTSSISIGMFTPMLMNYLVISDKISFAKIMATYSMLSAGLLLLLFMFFYPSKRFYAQNEIDNAFHLSCIESQLEDPFALGPLGLASRDGSKSTEMSTSAKFLAMFGISADKGELLKRSLNSYQFWLVAVIYAIVSIASSYYVHMSSMLHNQNDRWYLSIGIASSFVISLMVSPFIDKLGAMSVMWYEAVCLLPSLIMGLIPTEVPKTISIVLYSLFTAYSNSQFWLFVVETFDPAINTLVLGVLNVIAGVFTLTANEVYHRINLRYDCIFPITIVVNVLAGLQVVVVIALHIVKHKEKRIE